jgi:hypothetical protein
MASKEDEGMPDGQEELTQPSKAFRDCIDATSRTPPIKPHKYFWICKQ